MLVDFGRGLVGSRVVFMIVNWEQYYYPCFDFEYFNELYPTKAIEEADCTRLLYVWNGGLVSTGGHRCDAHPGVVHAPRGIKDSPDGRCPHSIPRCRSILRTPGVPGRRLLLG